MYNKTHSNSKLSITIDCVSCCRNSAPTQIDLAALEDVCADLKEEVVVIMALSQRPLQVDMNIFIACGHCHLHYEKQHFSQSIFAHFGSYKTRCARRNLFIIQLMWNFSS